VAVDSAHRSSIIGMPLAFSDDEYKTRLDQARQNVREAGLDALILFHQESMFYLFGYDQLGYWVYQAAVITPGREDVIVVARGTDRSLIEGLPSVSEVRTWRDDSDDDPTAKTCDVLREAGALKPGARIGVELRTHALLPYYSGRLARQLGAESAELVDASDLINDQRLVKSDTEVAYTRTAARALDAGYAAAFAMLEPGVTEANVLAAAMAGMLGAGGDVPAIVPPLSSGPRAAARTHGAATQRVVEPGETLVLEAGGCSQRYHAVGVQTKWLGGAVPAPVQSAYDGLLDALAAGRESTRAGVPVADVARTVNAVLTEHGHRVPGAHVGYGTGIGFPPTWLDNLRIKETDSHILAANMVFFMFVKHRVELDGKGIELFVGEPLLVTDNGVDRLSSVELSISL
jgi:Xaa-Pro dipeptidase